MADNDDARGFLARWSERKALARQIAEGAVEAGPQADAADAEGAAASDVGPASPLPAPESPFDTASLPDIETLTADSDVTAFLQRGVPAEFQRLALRKMWSIDPAIRDFIEVAENQYDFNNPSSIPGFGDLAPGTDIARLLAQAIGAQPPAPPAGEPEMHNTVADQEMTLEPPPHELLETTASNARDDDRPEAAAAAAAPPIGAFPAPVPPQPRRHGGALPT